MKRRGKNALLVLSGVAVFAISACGSFLLLPQVRIFNDIKGATEESTPASTLINNLINDVMSDKNGLSLKLNQLDVEIPTKKKEAGGFHSNKITTRDGAKINFGFSKLSLNGINMEAYLPLTYNDRNKELDLALLGDSLEDKKLYFNIASSDTNANDGIDDSWNAGYQVSVKDYVTDVIDPVTGGQERFEYGKLDFVIHDILEILSGGELQLNIDTYTYIDKLLSGDEGDEGNENSSSEESSSSEETSSSEQTSSSEESTSSSAIDTDALLQALEEMEQVESGNHPYFKVNLPLGDLVLPIGLAATDDFHLAGVDLPAKGSDKETVVLKDPDANVAGDEITLTLHADVSTITFSNVPTEQIQALPRLDNSLSLFERIAGYVASPSFGVSLDVDMHHHENGVAASYTKYGTDEVDEHASLRLDGDVDLSYKHDANGKLDGATLDAVAGNVEFARQVKNAQGVYVDASDKKQTIGFKYLDDDNDGGVYLNMLGSLKAKASMTALDELMGKFNDDGNDPQEQQTSKELSEVLDSVESVLETIQGDAYEGEAKVFENLKNQHYEDIVDMLEGITIEDNLIKVDISLDNLGFKDADISLELNGDHAESLLSLRISNLVLSTLTLNITLELDEYQTITLTDEERAYGEMKHLPSLVDDIKKIADDKKIALSIEGSLDNVATNEILGNGTVKKGTGLDIKANVAFDFSKEKDETATNVNSLPIQGTLGLKLTQREKDYYQDHNILLDVDNVAAEADDASNNAYFHYDSINSTETIAVAPAYENPENLNGINGSYPIYEVADIIDIVKTIMNDSDDRFTRISRLFGSSTEETLISAISSKEYFKIADFDIIKSSTITDEYTTIVVNGGSLGLDGDLSLTANFENGIDGEGNTTYGGLSSLGVGMSFGSGADEKALDLEIKLEEVNDQTSYKSISDQVRANSDDYSGLTSLVDYLASTAIIGLENKEGVSTYDLEGIAKLKYSDYEAQLAGFGVAMEVEGARFKAFASMEDMPVIRGVNAPNNERYYREFEFGLNGSRDSSIYFYGDGLGESDLMMTRRSDYGRLANVRDSVALTSKNAVTLEGGKVSDEYKESKGDFINYLVEYFLGINHDLLHKDSSSSSSSSSEKTSKAFHVEDLYKGFAHTENEGKHEWVITIGLNSLLGVDILDDVTLTLGGGNFVNEAVDITTENGITHPSYKAINEVKVKAGVSAAGNTKTVTNSGGEETTTYTKTGDRLSILDAEISLSLVNLANGYYTNGWTDCASYHYNGAQASAASIYEAEFLTFVNEVPTPVGTFALPTSNNGGKAWNHGYSGALTDWNFYL